MAIASTRNQRHWSTWLWPHGGLLPMYRTHTLLLVAILAGGVALHEVGYSDLSLLLMPPAAGLGATAVYAVYARRRHDRVPLTSPAWHTATLVLVVYCAVIVPTAILFRAALGHEFGTLVATEQEWIRAQERDAPLEMRAEARAEGYPPAAVERLAESRAAYLAATTPAPFAAAVATSNPGATLAVRIVHALDGLLPIESDVIARQRYGDLEFHYSPPGRLAWPPRTTGLAVASFLAMFAALVAWIRWSRAHIFYAEHATPSQVPPPDDVRQAWADCSKDEHHVLIQVATEGIANPHQQPLVTGLLERGLLTLAPELRPSTPAVRDFVVAQGTTLEAAQASWEQVAGGLSWRYVRIVFAAFIGGLAFFLVATQPGLQSGILGIATGLAGALTTGLKLRDAVSEWFSRGKAAK